MATSLRPAVDPEPAPRSMLHPAAVTRTRLNVSKLRRWAVRSTLSVFDQGINAGVGFLVNLLLARWLTPAEYGAFAVAFAAFLFISGFYNVLLLEPLTVMGPARHAYRLAQYFREQLAIHVVLCGGLGAAVLVAGLVVAILAPESPLASALIGGGIALPLLLLLWLVRRMCYVIQRPSIAVIGSTFYLAFVVAGLFLLRQLGRINQLTAFLLMGVGGLLAAALLWARLHSATMQTSRNDSNSISWRRALNENWTYGRWLVGSSLLNSVSTQVQTFLVASTIGLSAAGVLRAMQIPALIMVQVLAATGLIILPKFSYDCGNGETVRTRNRAKLVSTLLTCGILAFAALLLPFAGRVEHLFYGGKYGEYAWLMPLLVLVPAAFAASMGQSMALRAMQRPRFDLLANAIAAPVGVLSAVAFIHWWGLAGAAASMVLSYAAYSVATCSAYYRLRRTSGENESVRPIGPAEVFVDIRRNKSGSRRSRILPASADRTARCPVCGCRSRCKYALPHTVVWCCANSSCKLEFAYPQLEEGALNRAYEDLYYPTAADRHRVDCCENTPESVLDQVFSHLEERVGPLSERSLLDYGCGEGSLLRVARKFGFHVAAVEKNPQARSIAVSSCDARVYGDIDDLMAAEPGRKFDMITMWTVIEHLRQPWVDLARLRELLVPHGVLLISTINVKCLRARLQRHHWEQYRNPTHFYYFNSRSLASVVSKSGFTDFSEWRLRIRYPHHSPARRWLYNFNLLAGLSDGLFLLCRNSGLVTTSQVAEMQSQLACHSSIVGKSAGQL